MGLAPGVMKKFGSPAGRVLASSVIGGTASVLGGGKFANGAVTGAYVMLFNHMQHPEDPPKTETSSSNSDKTGALDWVQTGLDVAGLVPVVGEFFDGINALIYLARGDYLNAGLSAAAMIPIAGWGATGGKLGVKAVKTFNPTSFKKVSESLLRKNGISDIHAFKAEWLGTTKNLSHYDVVKHSGTNELLIIRKSTQEVIENTNRIVK